MALQSTSARRKVIKMFSKALANKRELEETRAIQRLPREKPMANLSETDIEARIAEVTSNANDANQAGTALADRELFDKFESGLGWAKRAVRLRCNGTVQVGSIVAFKDDFGQRTLLLIVPEGSNPLTGDKIGELDGFSVEAVSDCCPLCQALLGAPVSDHWAGEADVIDVIRGKRRVDKLSFQGSVLAIV